MAERRRDERGGRDVGEGAQAVGEPWRRRVRPEEADAWDELVVTARRTVSDGLVVGTSGNVSVRVGDIVLVTPSGVPYDRLTPDDTVGVDLDSRQVLGTPAPDERTAHASRRLPPHRRPGRRPHPRRPRDGRLDPSSPNSPRSTTCPAPSAARSGLPRMRHTAPRSWPRNMLQALTDRSACLLQNHGTIAYGTSLDQAFDRTAQLEWMCRLWLTASSVPGLSPTLLSGEQVEEAGERLRGMGSGGGDLASAPPAGTSDPPPVSLARFRSPRPSGVSSGWPVAGSAGTLEPCAQSKRRPRPSPWPSRPVRWASPPAGTPATPR